jgi:hypothetical protein
LVSTKEIWRFHQKIIDTPFLDVLLYKIREFRADANISLKNHLIVCSALENIEYKLDILCSESTVKNNKLCRNKLTHRYLRMCSFHKNKEIKKSDMFVRVCKKNFYLPNDLIRIISLYIYS